MAISTYVCQAETRRAVAMKEWMLRVALDAGRCAPFPHPRQKHRKGAVCGQCAVSTEGREAARRHPMSEAKGVGLCV
ncbi:MAG: hypothetical protein M0003_13060 [Acidithiobacillus sp.]|nr:hypothetical protein [Acidithiobacillus sp.]